MRQVLRTALKDTAGTVAVVCGAWHAPALAGKLPPESADAALLRGIPRRKTTLAWGAVTADQVRSSGTFRETWTLRWRPELVVAIIDAAPWGTTVANAATAKVIDTALSAGELGTVTAAVECVLLADLPGALDPVLRVTTGRLRSLAQEPRSALRFGVDGHAGCVVW